MRLVWLDPDLRPETFRNTLRDAQEELSDTVGDYGLFDTIFVALLIHSNLEQIDSCLAVTSLILSYFSWQWFSCGSQSLGMENFALVEELCIRWDSF